MEQLVDDVFNSHALGFRAVAHENPVPESAVDQRLEVVERHVGSAAQQRPGFSAQDQILGGPQTGSPPSLTVRIASKSFRNWWSESGNP